MELNEIRERTGIMGNNPDPSLDIDPNESAGDGGGGDAATKAAVAAKVNGTAKAEETVETKPEDAAADEESDVEEEGDGKTEEAVGAEEKVVDQSTHNAPAKKKGNSPIKAAFKIIGEQGKQITELTNLVKTVAESLKPKEEAAVKEDLIDKLVKELPDENPETIKKISAAIRQSTIQELKDQGLLVTEKPKPELTDEDRDALEETKIDVATRREVNSFNTNEWPSILPQLKKEYPNASEALLLQAREAMFNIATSEEGGVVIKKAKTNAEGIVLEQGRVKPYPLSYLLHQNRDKFNAILKVAKGPKSTEGGSSEIDNGHQNDGDPTGSDDNIEMSLDDQNPETFLKMQKAKLKNSGPDPVRIQGTAQA